MLDLTTSELAQKPTKSEAIDKLVSAFVAAQSELQSLPKTADNPFFKSKYVELSTAIDVTRPILSKHGLAVFQPTIVTDKGIAVLTVLAHVSGQYLSGVFPINPEKNTPQANGSALTYARRYSFMSMLCLSGEADDDGNAGSGKSAPPASEPRSQTNQRREAPRAQAVNLGEVIGEAIVLTNTPPKKPAPEAKATMEDVTRLNACIKRNKWSSKGALDRMQAMYGKGRAKELFRYQIDGLIKCIDASPNTVNVAAVDQAVGHA